MRFKKNSCRIFRDSSKNKVLKIEPEESQLLRFDQFFLNKELFPNIMFKTAKHNVFASFFLLRKKS